MDKEDCPFCKIAEAVVTFETEFKCCAYCGAIKVGKIWTKDMIRETS